MALKDLWEDEELSEFLGEVDAFLNSVAKCLQMSPPLQDELVFFTNMVASINMGFTNIDFRESYQRFKKMVRKCQSGSALPGGNRLDRLAYAHTPCCLAERPDTCRCAGEDLAAFGNWNWTSGVANGLDGYAAKGVLSAWCPTAWRRVVQPWIPIIHAFTCLG